MATINTLAKAGKVLDLFCPERPEWRVADVADMLGVPRSSAHALLSSLAEIGILQWHEGGRYRVGWRILELAEVRRRTIDVRAAAAPVMERLLRAHGETSHLAVRDRIRVLYIDKLVGNHNITVQGARVGTRLEMHCTAVGKVLLAYADPGDLDEFLALATLRRHTPSTITGHDAFRAELASIRARGVGFDLGEAVEDVFCAAAPIRDELGHVVAAISISAPVNRFHKHRDEYARSVKTGAADISRALADSAPSLRDLDRDYPAAPGLIGPRPTRS
jgi:DNA-binding IclR family transcriptional regulator